jgi:hypothetical protein
VSVTRRALTIISKLGGMAHDGMLERGKLSRERRLLWLLAEHAGRSVALKF